MVMLLSKLFGMEIYGVDGTYKGKVFDLIINLEKGRVETITTEPLKPKTKQEAKKILTEKSIPFKHVKSAKDIIIIDFSQSNFSEEEEATQRAPTRPSVIQRPKLHRRY